jgi:hypothetical protein
MNLISFEGLAGFRLVRQKTVLWRLNMYKNFCRYTYVFKQKEHGEI